MSDGSGRRLSLDIIYDEVGQRADAVAASWPDWPCRRGCSDCCRHLAGVPVATSAEWERAWRGYRALPPAIRADVRARVNALAARDEDPHPRHVTCPLLDQAEGACLIYADRPAACRAYGFYAARDGGRWCHRIEAIAVADGAQGPAIIWGNHAAVDRALADLAGAGEGASVDLIAWFASHPHD